MADETPEAGQGGAKPAASSGSAGKTGATAQSATRKGKQATGTTRKSSGGSGSGARKRSSGADAAGKQPATRKSAASGAKSTRTAASKASGAARKSQTAARSAESSSGTSAGRTQESATSSAGTADVAGAPDSLRTEPQQDGRHWLKHLWRAIALIGFGVVSWVVLLAAWAIAVLQFVVNLVRDEPNATLHHVNASLGLYLRDIFSFMGGHQSTERLPFPFSEFPASDPGAKR